MPPLGSLRRSRRRAVLQLARREPGCQPACGDLAGGPPQALVGDLGGRGASGRLGAQVAGPSAVRQESAQDGTVRAGRMLCAHAPGDLLGDHVRLLGGEAALLVGAGSRVADREDVVGPRAPGRRRRRRRSRSRRRGRPGSWARTAAGDARPGRMSGGRPGASCTTVGCGTVARHAREQLDAGGRPAPHAPTRRPGRRTRSTARARG